MPATDFHQSSSSPPSSFSHGFGFSILSRRRDQVHSMSDSSHGGKDSEIDAFQKRVSDQFHDLSAAADSGELLSIPWIRRLLDAFLCIQEEFKVILFNYNNASNAAKSPLVEKYVAEYFDRSVKALDVCNAIRDGIEQVRQWRNQLEIVLCALDGGKQRSSGSVGEGQFRRAKKALVDLAIGMLEEKDTSVSSSSHRNRSFGRNKESSSSNKSLGHYRSLSWSVSRTWSAAKQLQAISSNLVAPKANEIASTNGLNVAIFTMNYVLLFVMWALVAAIPCQDRGLQTHFYVTKQFYWAVPILSLHERILEESKKRDRRNACGLLREIHEIEKCARVMNELADSVQFPLTEEREREVRQRVKEVGVVYESLKGELDPLERQVREVFHRIVRSRTEGLESVGSMSR